MGIAPTGKVAVTGIVLPRLHDGKAGEDLLNFTRAEQDNAQRV